MSRLTKQTFSSFWKDNEGRAQCLQLKEEWGGKWTTERKWSLASVFVNEHAVWAGKGETNIGTEDLKSKKCSGRLSCSE